MKKTMTHIARMFHEADPTAQFLFRFWDGEVISFGARPVVSLHMKTERSAENICSRGFMGFGESYMSGELEVYGDLQELMRLGFAVNFDGSDHPALQKLRALLLHFKTKNIPSHAFENISYHYDRGDEFYRFFLDETMTYSCAYFKNQSDSLKQAQLNKYEHICRKLMLCPGQKLLDIGCGWGGMLIYAAQNYSIKGFGITLSRNQCNHVRQKALELGLQDQVQVALLDYRRLEGSFDRFVSIGMFEHVGREYIPVFVRAVSKLLKKGGLGLLQTIGKDLMSPTDPWTIRYIFPGGYIPCIAEILHHLGKSGFSTLDVENLRMHYAKTLDLWSENFEKNIQKMKEAFDDPFVRMWRLYLQSASAGFKYGNSRLFQILFSNGLVNTLPLTREHYCLSTFRQ